MRQNSSFLLKELAGVPYLLPYGQMIADQRRGLKTNATGVFLWNLLETEQTMEEVLLKCAARYEISEEELPDFRQDIMQFIHQLLSYGILVDAPEKTSPFVTADMLPNVFYPSSAHTTVSGSSCTAEQTLTIGGLNIKLIGPAGAFPPDFTDFICSGNAQPHQTVYLHTDTPQPPVSGKLLLKNHELIILEQEKQYLLYFPTAAAPLEIHLSKDASAAHCYCPPPFTEKYHYDLFHALRLTFLYLAQQHGMAALHSSSILYENKLWLFSGHSGMGKSTHTNLWKDLYHTPVINGDLNLLALDNGVPVVHGIPWCGTSGIYDTKTYPLGGIILLNQAKENTIEQLTVDQKLLLVSQRLISPSWTKELWNKNLNLVEQITEQILVCRLHCTKEKEAAHTMKQGLEAYLHNL